MSERSESFLDRLTVPHRELWNSIAAFRFESEPVSRSFASRLASENGWTDSYAQRVIDEYRRFLFLTSVASHVVCPSEQVDAVWHQHLLYSRSYWNDLCQKILHHPLHHDPSSGGPEEKRKHWGWYQQTLESYREVFGQEAPREIWPLPYERFDPRTRHINVDLGDHWVLQKPSWWPNRSRRTAKYAAVMLPVAAIGWGPFDLKGPEFLAVYACLVVIFFVASYIYQRMMRDVPVLDGRDLAPEEIACLKFGRGATVNVTVAGMLHDNELVATAKKGLFGSVSGSAVKFAPGSSVPPNNSSLERAIYSAVETNDRTLAELHGSLDLKTRAIEERLTEMGYLLDAGQLSKARVLPFAAMLILLGMGGLKIAIGISRGRPVEFLVFGCVVVLVTFLAILFSFRRSIAGDRLLSSLQDRYSDLKRQSEAVTRSRQNVLLGTAIFGAVALEGERFENLKKAWTSNAGSGDGWTSHGCSGDGCGGGGGGCGGGGCGGCGGG